MMISCEAASPVKGVRVSRRKGDGEGSLKQRVEAGRKVWVGRWVYYDADGKRHRPEKIVGTVAELPSKLKAREKLTGIMRQLSGELAPMPDSPTFGHIWARYLALNKPRWSKAQTEAVEIIIRRAILPIIGERTLSELTYEPLQAVLNGMVEKPLLIGCREETKYTRIGYGESAVKRARTYMRAAFEFALEEGVASKNPARKLSLPRTRKPCERFLSMDEVHSLTAAAVGRERLILRLFLVAGLRPAEMFALRTDDIRAGELRIDEAIKEREKQGSGLRLGDTKSNTSDTVVPITQDLEAKLRAWAAMRPAGSLLFPTEKQTTWSIGNYLKRVLKPLAATVGITDLTHQCLRRTCATHFAGDVKDRQTHMRHAEPATTLKHYQKTIPESQRAAVEELDRKFLDEGSTRQDTDERVM